MLRARSVLILSLFLTATLLLQSAHLRSFFGPRLVANRLHSSRHPGSSRRLLTQHRRTDTVVRESRQEPGPMAADPVPQTATLRPVPLRTIQRLFEPAYLQPFRDSQRQHQSPA